MKERNRRWKQLLSGFLCVALLVTSLPTVAFAATEDAQAKATEKTEQLSASEDITSEAEAVPVSEVENLRSETVKHFLNEDGSFTAVNYMTPVHYQRDGESDWTEIDNSLSAVQARSAGGETKYIPQDSPIDVQITDTADSTALVRLAGEEHQISWSYENVKKAKAEKKTKQEK